MTWPAPRGKAAAEIEGCRRPCADRQSQAVEIAGLGVEAQRPGARLAKAAARDTVEGDPDAGFEINRAKSEAITGRRVRRHQQRRAVRPAGLLLHEIAERCNRVVVLACVDIQARQHRARVGVGGAERMGN